MDKLGNQEPVSQVQQLISLIFKEEIQQKRVSKEIQLLQELDNKEYSIQVQKNPLGLKIIVQVMPEFLNKQNIKYKKASLDIQLQKSFPYEQPYISLSAALFRPSIADQRDLTEEILNDKYSHQLTMKQIVLEIPKFLKKIEDNCQSLQFLENLGEYKIGNEYDINELSQQGYTSVFQVTEVIDKTKKFDRYVVITDLFLLVFNISNLNQQFSEDVILVRLIFVGKISNIQKCQMTKSAVKIFWNKDAKTEMSNFKLSDQAEEFLNTINEKFTSINNMIMFQQKENLQSSSQKQRESIKLEDVTKKQFADTNINLILQNIQICEEQLLTEELSANTINTLTYLYQKAIEYLSAINDPNYQVILDKMQELLSKEEVQCILQQKQEFTKNEQEKSQIKEQKPQKHQSQVKNQNQVVKQQSSEEKSIFDDLFPQQGEQNKQPNKQQQSEMKQSSSQDQGQGEVQGEVQSQIKKGQQVDQIQKLEESKNQQALQLKKEANAPQKKQFKFSSKQLNLVDTQRFVQISRQVYPQYQQITYFDRKEKKLICQGKYYSQFIEQFDKKKINITNFYNESQTTLTKIIEYDSEYLHILYEIGKGTVKQYLQLASQQKQVIKPEIYTFILKSMLQIVDNLISFKTFCSNLSPHSFVLVPTNQFKEYAIRLIADSDLHLIDAVLEQEYITIVQKYMDPQLLQKLRDKSKSSEVTPQDFITSYLYTIVVIFLDYLNTDEPKQEAKQIKEQIAALPEKFGSFKPLLEQCVDYKENDLKKLIGGANALLPQELQQKSTIFDEQGNLSLVQEQIIKEPLSKRLMEEVKDCQPIIQQFNIGNKGQYLLKKLGSPLQLIYPAFISNQLLFSSINDLEQLLLQLLRMEKLSTVQKSTLDLIKCLNGVVEKSQQPDLDQPISPDEFLIVQMVSIIKVLVLSNQSKYQEGLALAQKIFEINSKIFPDSYNYASSDAHFTLGYIQLQLRNYNEALEHFGQAYLIRTNIFSRNHPSIIISMMYISIAFEKHGPLREALKWLEQANFRQSDLQYSDKLLIVYPNILESQGRILMNQKNYAHAKDAFQQAYEIKRRMYGQQHFLMISCYLELGNLQIYLKNQQQALQYMNTALDIARKTFGKSHPMVANCLDKLGDLCKFVNNYEQCVKMYQNSLKIRIDYYGDEHFLVSDNYYVLANLHQQTGEYEQALSYYYQALEIRKKRLGPLNPSLVNIYEGILSVVFSQKKYELALQILIECEELYKQVYADNLQLLIQFYQNKCTIQNQLKQEDNSMITQSQIIELLKKQNLPENQLLLAQSYYNLGASLHRQKKYKESLEQKLEGLKIVKTALGDQSQKLINLYYSIAETTAQLENFDDAINYLGEALKLVKLHKGSDEDIMGTIQKFLGIITILSQKNLIEQAFAINEKIQDKLRQVLGAESPFIDLATQQIENQLNQLM